MWTMVVDARALKPVVLEGGPPISLLSGWNTNQPLETHLTRIICLSLSVRLECRVGFLLSLASKRGMDTKSNPPTSRDSSEAYLHNVDTSP